jgi:hypothetical protein
MSETSANRRRNRLLIGAAVLVAAAVGVTLAVVLLPGGSPAPPAPAPPGVSVPSRNPTSSPPWGFTGGGWVDLCYRPIDVPPGYSQQQVPVSQPCAAGATRFTGLRQIALTAQAGADTDRLGLTWGSVQPRPPGQPVAPGGARFNWEPLVTRYRAMLQDGIRPIVVAWGAPPWARPRGWARPGACSGPGGAGCAFPPAPSHLAEWRTYLRGLMVHLPDMLALEIWNEPNSARFFAPHPSPALYARLLKAADQAAREVGFDRPIITGGLAPERPRHAGKVPPAEFLTRVYELAGRKAFDGIGSHPYPAGPPWVANMSANLDQLRAVARRFHDAGKPLWITEVGLGGTASGAGLFSAPLDRQGPILASMYRSVQGGDVRAFLIYNLYDSIGGGNRFGPYGVLTQALRPKPAYCYLAQHLGGTPACPAGTP